jgi:hypothetical protein
MRPRQSCVLVTRFWTIYLSEERRTPPLVMGGKKKVETIPKEKKKNNPVIDVDIV